MATVRVGRGDLDLSVESAGTQQRRIEYVGTVGRRDQDHATANIEAVHLDQELVEGLLTLVVATTHAGATVPSDGVDLVDEDDGRGILLGLLEEVTDAAGADAHEHLHEVRAGDRVERNARFACNRASQQRLAGSRRTVEQDALGDLGPDSLELRGLLEELLDLAEFFDRLLTAGHVGEGGLGHVLGDQLRLGLAELHDAAPAAALGLVHQEQEQEHDQQEREQGRDHRHQETRLRILGVLLFDRTGVDLLVDLVEQTLLLAVDPRCRDLLAVVEGGAHLLIAIDERDVLDLAGLDVSPHGRRRHLVVPTIGREVLQGKQDPHHGKHDPQPGTS